MKKIMFLTLIAVSAFGQPVRVMTYNLRVDFGGDGPNNWEFRRETLAGQIVYNDPDFIGTQEGKIHQLRYIDSVLTHHAFIGKSRDDSMTEGEFSAIFYNTERYKVIAENTFWLSPTPEKMSKGWDAALPRICTYGLFEEKKTGKRLYIFNTHLDHIGETARTESAKLILQKIAAINTGKLPVILTGDFNSEPDSGAYAAITKTLSDSKTVSKEKPFGPAGTFNGFAFDKPVVKCIDYIFASDAFRVLKHAVLSDSDQCRYPSDHLPVLAVMEF